MADFEHIQQLIRERDIRTLRVEFSDFHGVIRGKAVSIDRLPHIVEEGLHFALPTFALDLAGNVAMGTGLADEVGYCDMTALPDLDTFMVLPWEAHTAKVTADLYLNDQPLPLAPRGILKRVVAAYHEIGLEPVIGNELEFFLLRENGSGWDPYCNKPSMVYTINPMVDPDNFLGKLRDTMREMDMANLACAHEFFAGQYEINLGHGKAVESADRTSNFKQMVKEMAAQAGIRATFMAQPINGSGGSGYHQHLSLVDRQTGENRCYDANDKYGLSELARQFIAGQLAHAPAMMAVLAPTVNSYKRYQPFTFAPYYVVWGLDNRSTYIRIPPERKGGTRVENRTADGCANPYLVSAANLAAGLDGIKRGLDAGKPFLGDAYQMTGEEGYPLVIQKLEDALTALEQDEFMLQTLGSGFVQAYLAVKRQEAERFRKYVTDWEINEYSFYL
jgi:glutamine synthetase